VKASSDILSYRSFIQCLLLHSRLCASATQCDGCHANRSGSVFVPPCVPRADTADLWVPIPSGETDNEETAADLSNEADTPR
jgi:hypothetical protein